MNFKFFSTKICFAKQHKNSLIWAKQDMVTQLTIGKKQYKIRLIFKRRAERQI